MPDNPTNPKLVEAVEKLTTFRSLCGVSQQGFYVEIIDEIITAIRSADPEWQPIETAPKYFPFLGWCPDDGLECVCFPHEAADGTIWWGDYNSEYRLRPTHWRPRVAPPAALKEQSASPDSGRKAQ